jgi:acetolactate synthase I/II/III large subunit
VRIDGVGDLGDAIKSAIASGKPYLIDANIGADLNPGNAGVWELPRHGVSRPFRLTARSRYRTRAHDHT